MAAVGLRRLGRMMSAATMIARLTTTPAIQMRFAPRTGSIARVSRRRGGDRFPRRCPEPYRDARSPRSPRAGEDLGPRGNDAAECSPLELRHERFARLARRAV